MNVQELIASVQEIGGELNLRGERIHFRLPRTPDAPRNRPQNGKPQCLQFLISLVSFVAALPPLLVRYSTAILFLHSHGLREQSGHTNSFGLTAQLPLRNYSDNAR